MKVVRIYRLLHTIKSIEIENDDVNEMCECADNQRIEEGTIQHNELFRAMDLFYDFIEFLIASDTCKMDNW
ncbi:hypothetical protein Y032_0048g1574 [Ancylostoma ceylanicum]|uniref:Uncharacterized protein n=1 Tax=Ancylostoma ceylanicum TaxID=53326 RepID=A0A016UB58_9BILA|nr:hypothetical protein Y032_0048g1574 [Ancylostoma ceylanicum]